MDLITYKVITLGMYGVGKTSLLIRATQRDAELSPNYKCTIGVDFRTKLHALNNNIYKLAIWDTAGQERFQHINRLYYKDSQAVILVYDVGNNESFRKVETYYHDFINHSDGSPVFILVANKIDKNLKKVTNDEGQKLADKIGISFVEASALTGEGVDSIFDIVLKELESSKCFRKDIESFLIKPPSDQKHAISKCC